MGSKGIETRIGGLAITYYGTYCGFRLGVVPSHTVIDGIALNLAHLQVAVSRILRVDVDGLWMVDD